MSLLDINDVENQLNEQLLEDAIKEYFAKKYPEYPHITFNNMRGSFKNNKDDDVFVCNFTMYFNIVCVSLTSIDILNADMVLGITNKSVFGDYEYVDVGGGIKKRLTFKLFKQIYGFA